MRARFFLLDGSTNASSWYRALQYVPHLARHGVEVSAALPVPDSLYARLVEGGHFGSRQKLGFYGLFLAGRTLQVLAAGQFDVALIQRDLFPFGPPWLERLLRRVNPHLVYDTDDPVYLKPSFTPDTPFQRLRRFDKVAEVVRHARHVTVATEPIAAWARQHTAAERVTVLPMVLDPAPYERARATAMRGAGGRLVLGWSGTGGSVQYLNGLAAVLLEASKRLDLEVRAVSGAHAAIRLPGVPLDPRPWSAATVLSDLAGIDVGLVPLHDLPFEREKFPFKALQYMALGVPVLAARVGTIREVIQDGENGLLAGSPEEWIEQLVRLSRDAGLRARLGANGRQTLLDRFSLAAAAPRLAAVLHGAAR